MSIVDTTKDIYDLLKKSADLETQEQLMKLREEALEIQAENVAMKERVQQLETELAVQGEVEFDGRVYWRIRGDRKDGPFCQQCFDATGRLIRVQKQGGPEWEGYYYQCHTCKSVVDEN